MVWARDVRCIRFVGGTPMKSELLSRNPSSGARWKRMAAAFLIALGLVVVVAQIGGHAQQTPISLPYANSYLTTGNYVSGAIDFPGGAGVNGFVTGTIPMSGIPANADGSPADILAAWLYWETIVNDPAAFAQNSHATYTYGAQFRGQDLKVLQ